MTSVGLPFPEPGRLCAAADVLVRSAAESSAAVGWGDCAEAGWNRHTVFNDLNKGVEDAATAYRDERRQR